MLRTSVVSVTRIEKCHVATIQIYTVDMLIVWIFTSLTPTTS